MPDENTGKPPTKEEVEAILRKEGFLGYAKLFAVYGIREEMARPDSSIVRHAISLHPDVAAAVARENKTYADRLLEALTQKGVAPDYAKAGEEIRMRGDDISRMEEEIKGDKRKLEEERQKLTDYELALNEKKNAYEKDIKEKSEHFANLEDTLKKKWAAYERDCAALEMQKTPTHVLINLEKELKAEVDTLKAEKAELERTGAMARADYLKKRGEELDLAEKTLVDARKNLDKDEDALKRKTRNFMDGIYDNLINVVGGLRPPTNDDDPVAYLVEALGAMTRYHSAREEELKRREERLAAKPTAGRKKGSPAKAGGKREKGGQTTEDLIKGLGGNLEP